MEQCDLERPQGANVLVILKSVRTSSKSIQQKEGENLIRAWIVAQKITYVWIAGKVSNRSLNSLDTNEFIQRKSLINAQNVGKASIVMIIFWYTKECTPKSNLMCALFVGKVFAKSKHLCPTSEFILVRSPLCVPIVEKLSGKADYYTNTKKSTQRKYCTSALNVRKCFEKRNLLLRISESILERDRTSALSVEKPSVTNRH